MERENLEQIALAIEAAGNTAYKTTDWHSAPGYMRSAEIVRRFAILEAAPEPTSVAFHNLEVVMSYQIETEFSRTPVYESELSPRCSHTHTTCDECHERIER